MLLLFGSVYGIKDFPGRIGNINPEYSIFYFNLLFNQTKSVYLLSTVIGELSFIVVNIS